MKDLLYDKRILFLAAVILISLLIIFVKGINYGIEFEGGVRIPITFDKDLSPSQMDDIVNILKTRVSKFGLSQVVVRPLPPREVQIELAKGDETSIKQVEKILQQQGKFEAIINGKVAITGKDILPGSIGEGRISPLSRDAYRWEVDFAVTEEGASKFAAVAYGQANKPVYMFLDRPESALILLEPRHFQKDISISEVLPLIADLNNIEGSDIKVIIIDDWEVKKPLVLKELYGDNGANMTNATKVVIASQTSSYLDDLKNLTSNVKELPDDELAPVITFNAKTNGLALSRWKAMGLLSAPILSEGLAKGTPSRLVSVSGTSQTVKQAELNAKEIRSVLSGGRLPVNAIVGSTISVPAPLGAQFLHMSLVGAAAAFLMIILFVTLRYREPKLFLPIIVVSIAEIIILVAIIGGFGTIDFAAMAGIIAAMGVSLDAQIIITDEIFRRGEHGISKEEIHERVKSAFYIITRNVVIAVVAMLPLFFSGIVEIVGFATSTILGALLGLAISRPAYAAIVERLDIS